jgi:hypothetical protein
VVEAVVMEEEVLECSIMTQMKLPKSFNVSAWLCQYLADHVTMKISGRSQPLVANMEEESLVINTESVCIDRVAGLAGTNL